MQFITPHRPPPPPSPENVRASIRAVSETARDLFDKTARAALQKVEAQHVDAVRRIAANEELAVKGRVGAAEAGHIGGTPEEKVAALEAAHEAQRAAPLLKRIAETDFFAASAAMCPPAVKLLEGVIAQIGKAVAELPAVALPEPLPRWGLAPDLAAICAASLNALRGFLAGEIKKIALGERHIARFWLAKGGIITLADDGDGLQCLD